MSGPLPPIGAGGARLNPFVDPGQNGNPSDGKLYNSQEHSSSMQDLMAIARSVLYFSSYLPVPHANVSFAEPFTRLAQRNSSKQTLQH